MKIIFVCGLFPQSKIEEIKKNSKGLIQYGPNKFQYTILAGLNLYFKNLSVITAPLVGSYPRYYKKAFINKTSFFINDVKGYSVSFLLFPIISLFSKMLSILKRLLTVIENNNNNVILIHSPHMPYVLASVLSKLFYKNIHICLYINDLPEYMSANDNFFYKLAKYIEKRIFYFLLKFIDSFIVVTDLVPERLKIQNKPFLRIEGVYIEDSHVKSLFKKPIFNKSNNRVIFYSGSLDKRYGIDNLLKAFKLIKDKSFELWICGHGDMETDINEFQKSDNRIKFLGQKTHQEVVELQIKSDILINPRLPFGEYTKFSFPIKTLEFLASTKPCIMYRLPGIPADYYQYFYTPINFTIESLADKIIEVSEYNSETLRINGEKNRKFILEYINIEKKFKNLHDFLFKIINNIE